MAFQDARQIDQLCDEFEASWRDSGGRIRIEAWLPKVSEALRPRLFTELLAIDAQLRAEQMEMLSSSSLGRPVLSDLIDTDAALASDLFKRLDVQTNQRSGVSTGIEPSAASFLRRSLLSCPTFRGLTADAAAALERALQPQRFAPGERMLTQDEPAKGLFVVVSGRCSVHKRVEGHDTLMDQCPVGSVLGEMSLLTDQPCTATIRAMDDVEVLHLAIDEFQMLRDRFPELTIALSQLVSDRLGSREIDALCGRTLGDYRLIRSIARGGMGVIYEASPVSDPTQRVALKMLRHRFIHDAIAVQQFVQEAEWLQSLRHANLIAVRDSFVAYNTRFLVMDLCDGEDLGQTLQRHGKFDEATARAILGQIAVGLDEVHRRGVVHLDLKPGNVLLSRSGIAAIADFGLCQLLGEQESAEVVRGTPAYMPPEQLLGRAVDHRADWYALACLAYELVMGQRLFRGRDFIDLLEQKREQGKHPQGPPMPSVSAELRQVVRDGLRPEVADRTMDLAALAQWASPCRAISRAVKGQKHVG